MLDRAFFESYRAPASPFWETLVAGVWGAQEQLTRTRTRFEGFEPSAGPVLYATNSTQKYDFMPVRTEWRRRGARVVTVTKGKNYHQAAMAFVLKRVGVIPLASRGYLLLVDFTKVIERRPTDDEYRALRSHLDTGAALPDGAAFEKLQREPRELLGYPITPQTRSYRESVRDIYSRVMGETLRLSREATQAGCSIQMYPEGTVSSRLGEGRIGAVQLAWALGLPLVPVGMSGCRSAFRGQGLRVRGGEVVVRFGAPYRLPATLPASFRPFHPDDEQRHRETLEGWTADLMQRIDALLSDECRRQQGFAPDGTLGTHRFL